MHLKRSLDFCLQAADSAEARMWLQDPVTALSRIKVFRNLKLDDGILSGHLAASFALIGEVRFPFRSRFSTAADSAELFPLGLPAEQNSETMAKLGGRAWLNGDRVCYQAELELELNMPEGEKWGGRAFRKMAEAAFERTISRTLQDFS